MTARRTSKRASVQPSKRNGLLFGVDTIVGTSWMVGILTTEGKFLRFAICAVVLSSAWLCWSLWKRRIQKA